MKSGFGFGARLKSLAVSSSLFVFRRLVTVALDCGSGCQGQSQSMLVLAATPSEISIRTTTS